MKRFKSIINTNKESFKENLSEMQHLIAELNKNLELAKVEGTEESIKKARKIRVLGRTKRRQFINKINNPTTKQIPSKTGILQRCW